MWSADVGLTYVVLDRAGRWVDHVRLPARAELVGFALNHTAILGLVVDGGEQLAIARLR